MGARADPHLKLLGSPQLGMQRYATGRHRSVVSQPMDVILGIRTPLVGIASSCSSLRSVGAYQLLSLDRGVSRAALGSNTGSFFRFDGEWGHRPQLTAMLKIGVLPSSFTRFTNPTYL